MLSPSDSYDFKKHYRALLWQPRRRFQAEIKATVKSSHESIIVGWTPFCWFHGGGKSVNLTKKTNPWYFITLNMSVTEIDTWLTEKWQIAGQTNLPMAATGRQLKQSVKVFHSLMLYLRLPEKINKLLIINIQNTRKNDVCLSLKN